MTRIPEFELQDLKRRNPCHTVAARWVTLRAHGKKMIGPCPLHSPDPQANDSTSFECDAEGWVCATCQDGGDVVALVMRREGIDFIAAVQQLGGVRQVDPQEARRAEETHARLQQQRELEAGEFRERERARAWDIWDRGQPIGGTPAADYLTMRGLTFPAGVWLRFDPAARYYVEDRPKPRLIHTGPALLAAIRRNDGKFAGVHRTWLDLAQPKGKALIRDPKTGELLQSKKMRGSKKGGHIDLTGCKDPRALILGEGIEKVLAVWSALAEGGRDVAGTAFWTSGDLGNLGGRAAATVPHPFLKSPKGRPQRVSGPQPDLESASIAIPDSVERLVLLADGTSDHFLTSCTMARAAARYARPGLSIVAAWAPADADFDDLLREAA
jgi:hypothetical protein